VGFTQRLPEAFYLDVQHDVRVRLGTDGFAAGVFDDPDDVAYLTGFFHFPNERPVAVWLPVTPDDPVVLLIPELEREFAQHRDARAELVSYPEFPGIRPPFAHLTDAVRVPTGLVGYSGSMTTGRLEAVRDAFTSATFARTGAVDDARLLKREAEVALHRLRPGEVFMLSLGAGVGGRHVEGERTFILGEPSAEQERYYSTVLAAQQTGLSGLRAGRRCADVNAECLAVIRDAGLAHLLRHRQGHGIGLNIHEPPWLEDGDDTVLQPNMIVSDEPGLYVPGHGGYRISDSVLVGAESGEPLTFYPKSLDDIVVAA
jgi:Xaa-Pro aminopeptidase